MFGPPSGSGFLTCAFADAARVSRRLIRRPSANNPAIAATAPRRPTARCRPAPATPTAPKASVTAPIACTMPIPHFSANNPAITSTAVLIVSRWLITHTSELATDLIAATNALPVSGSASHPAKRFDRSSTAARIAGVFFSTKSANLVSNGPKSRATIAVICCPRRSKSTPRRPCASPNCWRLRFCSSVKFL